MNNLQETLVILNHFEGRINGRTNYCKRNVDFNLADCVKTKLDEFYGENLEPNEKIELTNGSFAREYADKLIIIHSYLCLNIIDIFSFNDEYLKFFTEKITEDQNIASRIRKVREKNKEIRKKINWADLKNYRNIGLAHNLRHKDENKEYRLSIKTMANISDFMKDLKKPIEYSETITLMFENIRNEFADELKEAYELLMSDINDLRNANAQHEYKRNSR